MANEIPKDVFFLRMAENATNTSRTGAFNTGVSVAIVSSTAATPIVVTVGSTATLGASSDVVELFIAGHLVNTTANGTWTSAVITNGTTITLTDSVHTGVGGATGTIYLMRGTPRYIPYVDGGLKIGEKVSLVKGNTQHKDRGPRYIWAGHRNRDQGTLQTGVHPENAGFLLNLPIAVQSGTTLPRYYSAEHYWDTTIGTGTATFIPAASDGGTGGATAQTGRGLKGLIWDGWEMTFDRESVDAIDLTLTGYLNAETIITAAVPTPATSATPGYAILGWPAQNPYRPQNVYIDLEFADRNGSFSTGWTGDRQALQSASLKFSQNTTVAISRPNTDPSLSNTWTQIYPGDVTADFQSTLTLNNADYLRLTHLVALRQARVRFMAVSDNPSGSTTSVTVLAAAGTSLVLSAATGFHVGDVLLLSQDTAGKQQVVTITALVGTTATISAADVAMNGGSETITVRNGAFEVKVHSMGLDQRSEPDESSNVATISLTGSAFLTPTTTSLITVKAYNDDFAGYPST